MSNELIKVLDAVDSAPGAPELRARTYELLGAERGKRIVDVGCGAGTAVAELNEWGAEAVGVDLSENMIAVARQRWQSADLRTGSAYDLPFGDGELAGYRADKVYHDLDQAKAIAEARRVLAPGGRIVLLGQDWELLVIDSDLPELTRRLVQERADLITTPRAARGYRALLLDAGFTHVRVEVITAVLPPAVAVPVLKSLTGDEQEWLAEQDARARDDRLFVAIPLFLASATR